MLTGYDEQISANARATNDMKKETTTQPHTTPTAPPFSRPNPYRGVIPVYGPMVETATAMRLNRLCKGKRLPVVLLL